MEGRCEFPVSRPSGVCAATGRPIAPGEPFVATLIELSPGEPLQRRDLSAQAWSEGAPVEPPARLFAAWRAVMPAPGRRREGFIDNAVLCDLFESIAESADARQTAFRYVLALLLVRRRLATQAGREQRAILLRWTSLSGRSTPGQVPFPVSEPDLDREGLGAAIEEACALLGEEQGSSAAGAAV